MIAVGGFAYGAINGDVHIHGDGRPIYTLELDRPQAHPPRDWLLELPSRLLDARHQVVPFAGRESELEALVSWRNADVRLSIMLLHGPAGQGKTRLAARFAELSSEARWKIVHARYGGDTITMPANSQDLTAGDSPGLLLIVDYADRWPHSHLEWLLRNRILHTSVPARVLLIARSAHGWPALRHIANEVQAGTDDVALPMLAKTVADRQSIFDAAWNRFAELHEVDDRSHVVRPFDLADHGFDVVLAIHMAALVAIDGYLGGRPFPSRPTRLSVYLLDREQAHWARLYATAHEGGAFHTPPGLIAGASFIAALTGLQSQAQAAALVTILQVGLKVGIPADQIITDHSVCYPPPTGMALEPLYPDLLAEDYLALQLPGHEDSLYQPSRWAADALNILLSRSPNGTPPAYLGRALTFLAAAADRWPHVAAGYLDPLLRGDPQLAIDAGSTALTTLANIRNIDLARLKEIESRLPTKRDTSLDIGAAAVTTRLSEHRLASREVPQADRADILMDLSNRLANAGQYQEALLSASQANQIYRQLAETPGRLLPAYVARLGGSHTNLGVILARLGREKEALAALREAVRCHRLGLDFPGLALALNNLAEQLRAGGDAEEAIGIAEQSVAVFRQLAGLDAKYLPGLAMAQSNLGIQLAAVGRSQDAMLLNLESIELFRRLAASDPAAHLPDLAAALSNLSNRLAEQGRVIDAIEPAEQAVAIRRDLAQINPRIYLPDLAQSISNLGNRLGSLGSYDRALMLTSEAVEIWRRLAQEDPVSFASDLADSLNNLGVQLSSVEQPEEALRATLESLSLRRQLAKTNAEAHLPELSKALANLGVRYSKLGQGKLALNVAMEATAIRRQLAARNAMYLPDLAMSLSNLGVLLIGLGHTEKGVDATEEAIGIRKELVDSGNIAILPDLAASLHNLGGMLASTSKRDEAPIATSEAITILRKLASSVPGVYLPALAASLNNLGNQLSEIGKHQDGLDPTVESAKIYRQLARANPGRFLGDLASALGDLGNRQWHVGERHEGLASTSEAVSIYRGFVRAGANRYVAELARVLNNLRVMLTELGLDSEAAAVIAELDAIRKGRN